MNDEPRQTSWTSLIMEFLRIPVYLSQQKGLIDAKDSLQLVATLLLSVTNNICEKWLEEGELKKLREYEQKLAEIPYPGEGVKAGRSEERIKVASEIIKLVITAIQRAEDRKEIVLEDVEDVDIPEQMAVEFERVG